MSDKPGVAGEKGKGAARGLARRLAERVGLHRALDAALEVVKPPQAPAPSSPRKPASEKRERGKQVLVRLSEAEHAELEERASRSGLTLPSYLREQCFTKPKTRSTHRPPIEREELAKLLGQFGKIGSNLNQLARAANMNEPPGRELDAAIADLRIVTAQAMRLLGRKP